MFNSISNSAANPMFEAPNGFPGSIEEHLAIGNAAQIKEYQDVPPQLVQLPSATGSSVVGIKFEGGVMIGADTLVSYGALARYNDVPRVFKANEKIVFAGGLDFANFQYITRLIEKKILEDHFYFDNQVIGPRSIYTWLRHILYHRRCQMEPLMTDMVVAGRNEDNTMFLGSLDALGTAFETDIVATGFGKQLVVPLVREAKPKGRMYTKEEASRMMHKSFEVLYYRDTRSNPRYMVGICTENSCKVCAPSEVDQNWITSYLVDGY